MLKRSDAFWVTSWPFAEYVKHAWPGAWVCSAFRTEGREWPASQLIVSAIAAIKAKFGEPPEIGMVSFVDPSKVKHKRDPGRCFLKAGFKLVGKTKGGLLAFLMSPGDMPEPLEASNG